MEVYSCVSYTEKEYYNGWKAFLCPTRLMNLKLQGPLCTFSAYSQGSGRGSRNIFTWLWVLLTFGKNKVLTKVTLVREKSLSTLIFYPIFFRSDGVFSDLAKVRLGYGCILFASVGYTNEVCTSMHSRGSASNHSVVLHSRFPAVHCTDFPGVDHEGIRWEVILWYKYVPSHPDLEIGGKERIANVSNTWNQKLVCEQFCNM